MRARRLTEHSKFHRSQARKLCWAARQYRAKFDQKYNSHLLSAVRDFEEAELMDEFTTRAKRFVELHAFDVNGWRARLFYSFPELGKRIFAFPDDHPSKYLVGSNRYVCDLVPQGTSTQAAVDQVRGFPYMLVERYALTKTEQDLAHSVFRRFLKTGERPSDFLYISQSLGAIKIPLFFGSPALAAVDIFKPDKKCAFAENVDLEGVYFDIPRTLFFEEANAIAFAHALMSQEALDENNKSAILAKLPVDVKKLIFQMLMGLEKKT